MIPVLPYVVLTACLATRRQGCLAASTVANESPCDYDVDGYLKCDEDTSDWLLKNGAWAGNVSGELLVSTCPSSYCTFNESGNYLRIPSDVTDIGQYACNVTHRMGITCGACQPHYGPAYNSDKFDCVPCDDRITGMNWVYYLLSVYLPLFAVFLLVIAFNVRLISGPFNAFVLYAQTISSTLALNADGTAPLAALYGNPVVIQKVYQIVYDPFNLNIMGNLVPPRCLSASLTSLDMLALKYLEAFFPLVMVISVLVLFRLCSCCGNASCFCHQVCKRISLAQVFAAFVLLSYNRFCEITIYLLSPNPLWNKTMKTVDNRVYFYGDYQYDDHTYLIGYRLPAWMVMIVLILLPTALLHYPMRWLEYLVGKVKYLQWVYPSATIAILLDTFQGCFKDNRRYFAGLYLLFRLLFLGAYTQPVFIQYLFQQIVITSFVFLFAILKPYKNKRLNSVDLTIFVNMALINSLVWYTVIETDTNRASIRACLAIECILVFLPMVYIICYILWHCVCQLRCCSVAARRWLFPLTCCRHLCAELERRHASHGRTASTDALLERSSDGSSGAKSEDIAYLYGISTS